MQQEPEMFRCPVKSLQTMLRVIAYTDDSYPTVIPDGIYGDETRSAVAAFQKNHAMPVTGVADQATWEQIAAQYDLSVVEILPEQPIQISVDAEETAPWIPIAQCMLSNIAANYHCISAPLLSGINDEPTIQAVENFQNLCGLPMTGRMDKCTWKNLCLQFPAM